MDLIRTHKDLNVYNLSFNSALTIYRVSKTFPAEERYSLTDQVRRSSRSVAANIAEAFRKRRYEKAFVAKLSDAEGEACETQVWLDFAFAFGFIEEQNYNELYLQYEHILGMLVKMIKEPGKWSY